MNKEVVLTSLRRYLKYLEFVQEDLVGMRNRAWYLCDKEYPDETAIAFKGLKALNNQIRSNKRKLKNVRESIRAIKKL